MKKILTIVLFLQLFLFTSCLTDFFSKNKDNYKDNETSTTEVTAPENSSEKDTKEELSLKALRESLISDTSDTKNATLEDLIKDEPETFEEPLVRDLEYVPQATVVKAAENNTKTNLTDEVEDTPATVVPSNTQIATEVTPVASTSTQTGTNKASTASLGNKPAAVTSSTAKTSAPVSTTTTPAPKSVTKTSTSTTPVSNSKTVTESPDYNDYSETSITTSSGTPLEDEVETTAKTSPAPKTSAGTPTENKPAVIPTKPAATGTSAKTETKPAETSSNYPEAKKETVEDKTETVAKENTKTEIKPSRKISLNKGETLVVEYPGKGWIYLGSDHEYNNLESKGRKAQTDATTYTLIAKESGTQIQHFYKTDSITGNYIDDYIEVTVNDVKGSPFTEIHAPDYKEIVPEKAVKPAVSSDKLAKPDVKIPDLAKPKTGERQSFEYTPEDTEEEKADYIETVTTDSKPALIEDYDGDDLLKQAQALFEEKKYEDALKVIDVFLDFAISKRDKGLYLKAQILEADSQIKNIKEAISCYNNVIDNYPASDLWEKANKRIIYLKRFYLEAR